MPSLNNVADRHVPIDHRPGQYLCFPDVCLTTNNTLLVAYNEYDQHVGTRRQLLLKSSPDQGATWSEPRVLRARVSHCPRLTVLSGGRIYMSDDYGPVLLVSQDNGLNWAERPMSLPLGGGLIDRFVELGGDKLFTTAHSHRGTHPHPATGQAATEQMGYVSNDLGNTFSPLSVIAYDQRLVLCEASVFMVEDKMVALMRENSGVYEPMYYCVSRDQGRTWSRPRPTPLIGHRPTAALASNGKLLVTYRNVGPDGGIAAWMGDYSELDDFKVHGLSHADNPKPTDQGLSIENSAGGKCVRYALRPFTDPQRAAGEFEAELRVDQADENGCALHFGIWWRLYPDRIVPEADEAESTPLEPGRINTVKIAYARGNASLEVNGEYAMSLPIEADKVQARAVLVGARSLEEDNACSWLLKRLKLRITEPAYARDYTYAWHHSWGLPDGYAKKRIVELKNDRLAAWPDYGYSGWTELEPGRFFCVYHYGGGRDPDYQPMRSSRILGTWLESSDFS